MLPQVVAFVLLLSLCLQPLYAQAEEEIDIDTESTSVAEEIAETSESEEVEEPESSEEVVDEAESADEPAEAQDLIGELTEEESEESEDVPASSEADAETTDDEVSEDSPDTNSTDLDTAASSTTPVDSVSDTASTSTDTGTSDTATSTDAQSDDASSEGAGSGSSGSSSEGEDDTDTAQDEDGAEINQEQTDGADERDESDTDPAPETDQASSTDETATSTEDKTDEPTVVAVVHTDNAFSFSESECTLVDDGSYYCHKTPEAPVMADDLFAAPDQDGDLEIFIRRNGEEVQLTNNRVDDASPFYDPSSNTVVWHRLDTDRYQIILYDLDTNTESQLTNTSVNNMEPARSGDHLVWQRWVKNNWEIVLYEASSRTETVLTESIAHDIAPHVRGDLVIRNVRHSDGTQLLQTYEITSGLYNEISDPDGVAVSNPRMVVVYDAEYQNGDTVTKGFDLVTGEIVPLQQVPRELPDTLPDPESTGETRALVAPTVSKPESDDTELDDEPEGDESADEPGTLNLASATTAVIDDGASGTPELPDEVFELDLSTTTPVVEEELEDDVFDLVVPTSTTTSSSTQTNS